MTNIENNRLSYEQIVLSQINKIIKLDRLNSPNIMSYENPIDYDLSDLEGLIIPLVKDMDVNRTWKNIVKDKQYNLEKDNKDLPTTDIDSDIAYAERPLMKAYQSDSRDYPRMNKDYFMYLVGLGFDLNILKRGLK